MDDPLSQTIGLLRPKALLWKHMEWHEDWAVRFPQDGGVVFGLITAGSCHLEMHGIEPTLLCAGDYILLLAPGPWVLRAGNATAPIDYVPATVAHQWSETMIYKDSEARACRVTGGHFVFETVNGDLLASLLPKVIRLRSFDDDARRLRAVLDMIDDEAASDRPGRQWVLERLLEIMLATVLRLHIDRIGTVPRGMLAGLADPKISRSLRELHADVGREWTVRSLASCAGMSRSVFAKRFTEIVGVAPIDYLLNWRMALSKDALRFSNQSLSDVALAVGYRSTSAFSTAFSRTIRSAPGEYRSGKASSLKLQSPDQRTHPVPV